MMRDIARSPRHKCHTFRKTLFNQLKKKKMLVTCNVHSKCEKYRQCICIMKKKYRQVQTKHKSTTQCINAKSTDMKNAKMHNENAKSWVMKNVKSKDKYTKYHEKYNINAKRRQ